MRERKEKLAKQELAQAMSRRSSSQADLSVSDARLESARAQQRSAVGEPRILSGFDLLAGQAFVERIEAQRGMHALELQQCEAEVVERDANVAAAATQHEMLKRLSERQRGEHEREVARLERNTLDEIATVRFGRGTAA